MSTTTAINVPPPSPQWLYTFNNGNFRKYQPSEIQLLPDRYIKVRDRDLVPLEDLGDCLLIDKNFTPHEAFELWDE